jgi:hypothetical protein
MIPFSKLKPKDEFAEPKDKVLYKDEHVKIIQFEDWSIIKQKDAVCCIPYLIESNQIILRHEYVPTFKYLDGQEYHVTLICGGIEQGETPDKAVLRELEEEAGIVLSEDYKLEQLKPLFVSKSQANKFYTYIIPLNEKDYHEVISRGDGSKVESMSKPVKIDAKYLGSVNSSDLITDYMLLKVKEYLNLTK